MKSTRPPIERIKELLDYNPTSGAFVWKVARPNGVRPGDVCDTQDSCGHIRIRISDTSYGAHRVAYYWDNLYTDLSSAMEIDHINRDKTDNRIANLREVPRSINMRNKDAKMHSSKYTGVSWHARIKKWHAQIRNGNRVVHLGYFETEEAAHAAYLETKRRIENDTANNPAL